MCNGTTLYLGIQHPVKTAPTHGYKTVCAGQPWLNPQRNILLRLVIANADGRTDGDIGKHIAQIHPQSGYESGLQCRGIKQRYKPATTVAGQQRRFVT